MRHLPQVYCRTSSPPTRIAVYLTFYNSFPTSYWSLLDTITRTIIVVLTTTDSSAQVGGGCQFKSGSKNVKAPGTKPSAPDPSEPPSGANIVVTLQKIHFSSRMSSSARRSFCTSELLQYIRILLS